MSELMKLDLLFIALMLVVLFLTGCGSDDNPFENRFSPAAWCNDGRGGLAYVEYGYAYCENGEYIAVSGDD